tara:strand:+ start:10137 stop:10277 length:141 start_codon:yes stop_codon:yes gene_type:complete
MGVGKEGVEREGKGKGADPKEGKVEELRKGKEKERGCGCGIRCVVM